MKPDIREEQGWFRVFWNGTYVGRFDTHERALKVWERWERTNTAGIVARPHNFTAYPRGA